MSNLKRYQDDKKKTVPHLYRDEVTKIFYAVKRIGKFVRKESLETTDERVAKRDLYPVLAKLGDKVDPSKLPNKLVGDFWQDMIEEKKSIEIRPQTLVVIDRVWRNNLKGFWENVNPADIRPEILNEFMAWHRRERPGAQFFNTFKYLKNLFNIMLRAGAIQITQVPRIEIPRKEQEHHDKKKGRIVTPDEFQALVQAAKNIQADRMLIMVQTAYTIGHRKMEMGELEKSRVEDVGDRIFVHLNAEDTKTGLPRSFPIPTHLNDLVRQQLKATSSAFVFPRGDGVTFVAPQVIDREWKTVKEAAKIRGRLRFHDLRHTAATNMAKANVNPILAATLLGMSITVYQKTYLKLEAKDLILIVDQMSSGVQK